MEIIDFINDNLLNKPVRLYVMIPPNSGTLEGSSLVWLGFIEYINYSSLTGGYLIFRHIEADRKRLQCDRSILNLGSAVIYSIDELIEKYDNYAYVTCPKCEATIRLEPSRADDIDIIEMTDEVE